MYNNLNKEGNEDSKLIEKKNNSKMVDYIIQVALVLGFGIYSIWHGIRNHDSIVGSFWFIVVFSLTFIIANKIDPDGEANGFGLRLLLVIIFIPLIIISLIIYFLINYFGLDLLKWTF